MLPILEMGCFIYNEDDGWGAPTLPENNPVEDTSQEKRAMICRQVRYTETLDEYVADPIAKTDDGYTIGITYEFNYGV